MLDFAADVAYYTGLDTLPGNQNVPTLFFEDILHGQLELNYTNTRKSLGAVNHEKGWRWDIVATADHANNETIPKLRLVCGRIQVSSSIALLPVRVSS